MNIEYDIESSLITSAYVSISPIDILISFSFSIFYIFKEIDHIKRKEGKLGRIIIPVPADSIQQEALLTLKKLKV